MIVRGQFLSGGLACTHSNQRTLVATEITTYSCAISQFLGCALLPCFQLHGDCSELCSLFSLFSEDAVVTHTHTVIDDVKQVLRHVKEVWPQFELDGLQNVWIVKPGAKSRGRGQYNVTWRNASAERSVHMFFFC